MTANARTAVPTDTSAGTAGSAAPAGAGTQPGVHGRDRYLDLLRAVALVRVVVYHIFGWAWLTLLFPSMGVMFALAGLADGPLAGAARRSASIRGRIRRLLPPLWAVRRGAADAAVRGGWKPRPGARVRRLAAAGVLASRPARQPRRTRS